MPADGYKSITVRSKYYVALKAIADNKNTSITQIVESLVEKYSRPFIRAMIDEITARNRSFHVPYEDFVLDPKIKIYESTAWVRSEAYTKHVGHHMLVIEDRVRHDPEFKAERVFIVPQISWEKKGVWKMIGEWLLFRFLREDQFSIFVIRENRVEKILTIEDKDGQEKNLTKYYDMGIYAEPRDKQNAETVVGFLEVDAQSRPGQYTRFSSKVDPKEIENAEKYFKKLRKHAQIIEDTEDLEKLEKQPYSKK